MKGKKRLTNAQRMLLGGATAVFVLLGLAGGGYYYWTSAPDRAEAAFQRGIRLAGASKFEEAIATFDGAISTWDQHARAYLERGTAKRVLKQLEGALADFEQAAALDPSLAEAFTARGMIFRDRGELDKAAAEFSRSIKVRPTMDAYFQRGQIEDAQGNHAKAIEDYDRAIEQYRTAPFVYMARSASKKAMGDEAGAAEDRRAADGLLHELGR